MKKLCLFAVVLFTLLNAYVPAGKAAGSYKLRGDTVSASGETNIYLGIPGNGAFDVDSLNNTLAKEGNVWQNTMVIDFFIESSDDNCPVPQWKPLKLLSGQKLDLVRCADEWNPKKEMYYRWELKSLPKQPGDSKYKISCTVGGK